MPEIALSAVLATALLAAAPGGPGRVLLVSIDALHPDALTPATMPNVARWAQAGKATREGRSTNPPKTLVAHAAMLTGLTPERSGKTDNDWDVEQPRVGLPTLLDDAHAAGYRTAYFYSKEKLGFLVTAGVDEHALAPDDGISRGRAFLAGPGRRFLFLHVSGLEWVGMESGWLSPAYLAKAAEIDRALGLLLAEVERRGDYAVAITSDHAGHAKEHGTAHPEDGRRPLVLRADKVLLPDPGKDARDITDLRRVLAAPLIGARR